MDELRHCVYCRDAGRACTVRGGSIARRDICGEHVRCETCGASGPIAATFEEAAAAWNGHTASVVRGLVDAENLRAIIGLGEKWKRRALASAAFADDLATLMTEVMDKIQADGLAIAAKHRDTISDEERRR